MGGYDKSQRINMSAGAASFEGFFFHYIYYIIIFQKNKIKKKCASISFQ